MHDIDRTQLETASLEGEAQQEAPGEVGAAGETAESPLPELEEIELATELLEVASAAELEQFLGGLLSRVGRAAGRFVRSDTGRALGGILRGAVKKALPVVGRGIGQWIAPGRGGDPGATMGVLAGQLLGLELEGLSQEDREFEISRQLVRFAASAARQAALAPLGPPGAVARRAAALAARRYAPGLLRRLPGRSSLVWPRRGQWIRRGRVIVLYGG